ncbi:hypothetical protein RB595_005584 [Gaeumannomyces hyphopodioides]
MSDAPKPVETPVEATPAVEAAAPAAEPAPAVAETAAPAEAATTEAAPATTEAATEGETPAAAATEEAKKEEVVPIEEGFLESKGTKFPQNFIYTKRFFWFGSDAVEPKVLAAFVKSEKSAEVAHNVAAWASQTGAGLLFYVEKGTDKAAPSGAIQLSEASEPVADGPTKFHFTSNGHKHTFKAANTADRDNWVAQLKAKTAEAKEAVATVTEGETYKATLESFKPAAPVKKEEPKAEEAAPTVAAPEEAATTEAPVVAEEPAKEPETLKPEEAKETNKERRSASRKRESVFGSLFGKKGAPKEDPKKEEAKAEEAAASPAEAAPEVVAAEAAPAATEAPVEVAAEVPAAAAEEKPVEAKPVPTKRASIFGNLSFGKKKAAEPVAAAEGAGATSPAKDAPEATPVAETAPVIPAVETTAPLSTEVTSPATVPTETVDGAAASPAEATPEVKKEMKSDKRKSSLPFTFGKKEKASSDEEGEKTPKSPSAFSKLRATIKGKGKAEKPAEKPVEKTEEVAEAESSAAPADKAEEAPKPAEAEATPATEEAKPVAAPVVAATA